ncbi:MAG: SixA phosphatase family protein [Actinomycetota bacterium]
MELLLVRHAISAERDDGRWPDDRDRPLTRQGEERMKKAARGLGRIVPGVDVMFASPLARAWRTAEILHEVLDWPEPASWAQLEPDRSPAQTVLSLDSHADTERIALVGHEPNLSEVASYLLTGTGRRGVDLEMKKGGVACLGVDGTPGPGTAWLRWLATPRMLRSL